MYLLSLLCFTTLDLIEVINFVKSFETLRSIPELLKDAERLKY